MKRFQKTLILASIIAAVSAGVILIVSLRSLKTSIINADALSLASDLATNLTAASAQLTNLAAQTEVVDTVPSAASLRQTFDQYDQIAGLLERDAHGQEKGDSALSQKQRDWAPTIFRTTAQGRESLSQIENQTRKLDQTRLAVSRSATSIGELIAAQQEIINRLIAIIVELKQPSSNGGPIAIATALVGLLGTISGILIAWRTDARELLKLRIEFERLHIAKPSGDVSTV